MKVHVLQHVPFEDIGGMAGWLAGHGAELLAYLTGRS